MAMKIASFLRCGVVIVLSLVAGRAVAQSDSMHVNLHFVGHSYSTIVATQYYDEDPANRGWFSGPNAEVLVPSTVDFDFEAMYSDTVRDTVAPPNSGLASPGTWIYFTIDSENSTFSQISLSFYQDDSTDNPFSIGYYESNFDSIAFIRHGAQLSVVGSFQANYNVGGIVSGPWPDSYAGYFGQLDTIGQEEDSLYIEISPFNASVSSSQSSNVSELLLIWNSSANSIAANFPLSDSPRILEISDLLGRSEENVSVPEGIESMQLSNNIPPGCYFARLGDQVAKFVVPPR
jgi:hypothetical protein